MSDLEKKARADLFRDLSRQMAGSGVPVHLQPGLARFFVGGILPGSFLSAVLQNNLRMAVLTADQESQAGLRSIVRFLTNSVPIVSWGSGEKVAAWRAMTDEERADAIGVCLT